MTETVLQSNHKAHVAIVDKHLLSNNPPLDFGRDDAVKNLDEGKPAFWLKPVRGEYACTALSGDANIAGDLFEALSMWKWRRRGDEFAKLFLDTLIPLNAAAEVQLDAAYGELSLLREAAE